MSTLSVYIVVTLLGASEPVVERNSFDVSAVSTIIKHP